MQGKCEGLTGIVRNQSHNYSILLYTVTSYTNVCSRVKMGGVGNAEGAIAVEV